MHISFDGGSCYLHWQAESGDHFEEAPLLLSRSMFFVCVCVVVVSMKHASDHRNRAIVLPVDVLHVLAQGIYFSTKSHTAAREEAS